MSTISVSLLPPVGSLYGALYFGTVMSTAFYGIACLQTFFYYVHYQNDPLSLKILVAVLCALNTAHEALAISGTFKYLMAGLVNPVSFLTGNPELILQLLLTATIAVPAQGFFVYRIFIFNGRNFIPPFLWVLVAILQLGSAFYYVVKALYISNGIKVVDFTVLKGSPFTTLATLCLSVAAGVDILLAIFLTFLLIRKRPTMRFASTTHILQSLIAFAVNTGTWTATFALLTVVLLHVFPTNLYYAVSGIPLCAVYCNTVLANLNARAYIGRGRTTNTVDVDLFTFSSSRSFDRQYTSRDVTFTTSAQQDVWKATEVIMFAEAQ